jgi:hypothetical protein
MFHDSQLMDTASSTFDDAGTSTGASDEDSEKNQIAAKETRAVLKLRISVIVVLIACAIAVSITIYHLTQASEYNAFQIQYRGAADKVLKAFEDVLEVHAGALASLSVAMTTHGK